MILIVSPPEDDHAARVAAELADRGMRSEIVDSGSLLRSTSAELEYGDGRDRLHVQIGTRGATTRTIDLARITTGWWRRDDAPRLTRLGADLDGVRLDSSEVLEAALSALDIAWINDPAGDRAARRRPLLWSAATRSGLELPHTVVTRDPAVAHRFAIRHLRGGIVATSLLRHADDWTGSIDVTGVCALDELIDTASGELVLQERLAGTDVRVLVTGSRMLAFELGRRAPGEPLEIALAHSPQLIRPTELPDAVAAQVRSLLGRLGLVQACVELRRTPDGGYRFLDLDTTPQWLAIEQATGSPVTAAFVDELVEREAIAADAAHLGR